MKTKLKGILTLLLAFVVQITFAQEKTVSGTVSESSGVLPGVSVSIKGTTQGTETDFDGKYSIKAKVGDILIFRYLGYETVEKTVGTSNIINVSIKEGANVLDEIIVTGLGISKKEKAIGYAVQKVSGASIDEAKEPNIVNSLQGRIAGVQIQGSPSSLGGSSRITIRGSNSFLGNNQPLFIVDGVPISNASYTSQGQANGFGGGAYDYGNAAAEIDPSNIQTMSVLKGAAATSIYGSRGANGVILITTKSGKNQKGLGVSFDSSVTFDQVRNLIPIQTTYGGGSTYNTASGFNEFNQDGVSYLAPNYAKDGSWGPRFDPNVLVRHWDSWDPGSSSYKETRPWVAPENSYESFFNTGVTLINTVALSGADEKGSFRAGYTNLDQTGVTPEGALKRNTINLNSNYNLTDKLKASVAFTYVKTEAENRNATGYDNANPMQGFTQWWQSNLDVERLRTQQNTTEGNQYTWNPRGIIEDNNDNLLSFDSRPNFFDNPSWVRENYLQEDVRNRVFGNANISYAITDKLSFTTQFGTDFFQFSSREGIPLRGVGAPSYSETERRFQETNIEARLNYNTDINDDLTFNGFVGVNRMRNFQKRTTISTTGGIVVDRFFNIANSALDPTANTFESLRGINSIFGSASFGFKDMLFLDLSARNDWSSTLPEKNNSYFYPSASVSFALSEIESIKESEVINFAKVRASIAQAGNDSAPYRIADVYNPINPNFAGNTLYNVPNSQQNPDLVNELTTEIEFGFLVKLLRNRLTVDAAYYSRTTEDQIFNVPVSAASGYTSRLLNAGEMKNSGLELQISGTPIKNENFSWDLSLNLTSQNNEVVELLRDENGETLVESIGQGATWAADLRIQEGLPYMALFGQDFVYNENGDRLVNSDGTYQFTSDRVYLGSAIADWTGGFSTAFNYKNFTLSALFDFQVGGIIHSTSLQWSKYSGMHPETVSYNGVADVRADGLLLPGVKENGQPNDVRIADVQTYYSNTFRVAAPNVYDASFIKFRDVRLSYNIPAKILAKTPFNSLSLSAFGRNLGILYSEVPFIDPQVVTSSGNQQGLENAQIPPTSSFGFNLSAKF
ncbi:SusC/RagA family TonB-linked outer membrane protein [Polaribacter litorisediminis]|uniref:SusC/RagA family TonB-linked outer membrane protein n=1 Tax=Polaribacter litorisediminis TaxID=1908341 RepID=UPI001CBB6708|nr:SusC/RagA family TonB-linked outer membrane protein [Polaribacter litorisediminis]UAM98483.1 SusC/RagA family TonB-linked outer membrane protein [Polaribacter litorisediminis]